MEWSYDRMVITSNQFIYDMLMAQEERNGVEAEATSLAEGQQQSQ